MLIAAPNPSLPTPLPAATDPAARQPGPAAGPAAGSALADGRDPRPASPLAPAAAAGGDDNVRFSPAALDSIGQADAAVRLPGMPSVYAEVWKDGQRIAQIDSHGRVVSMSGLVPSAAGGSQLGPLLAAQRAAQVAQAVGGEVRVGGQSVDSQTLVMRERLAKAYAV